MRVVFMGSPEFALPTLRRLIHEHQVEAVVCQPDRPAGRGRQLRSPPTKQLALEQHIPVLQPKRLRDPDSLAALEAYHPELIVVAAYGQILPQTLLDLPEYGSLNVHASLLPRWRGAAPIQAALLHGDRETGVTIMLMDAGMDTGPILTQRAIEVTPEMTAGSLSDQLAELGAQLLSETIPPYITGELQPAAQDDSIATQAPRLSKQDGELDFHQTAEQLARQVRAFEPWPGSYTFWKGRRLAVKLAHAGPPIDGPPGLVLAPDGEPAVAAGDGSLILDRLQLAGRKETDGADFARGAPELVGGRLPSQ